MVVPYREQSRVLILGQETASQGFALPRFVGFPLPCFVVCTTWLCRVS